MDRPRYLTKSRFKLGMECPTKLFYTSKKQYPDQKMDDPFLAALADGGFQVGELAKYYYPGGTDITTLDYKEALDLTNELLKQDDVIIYEPAICYKNLFIRVDVLVKKGNRIELIEVKAKSYNRATDDMFSSRDGKIKSVWKPYIYDVAFQTYVMRNAFPQFSVTPFLMMADKAAECMTDGLNQKFRLIRDASNRKGIKVSSALSKEDLYDEILCCVAVENHINQAYFEIGGKEKGRDISDGFATFVHAMADAYERDELLDAPIGARCQKCEFKCSAAEEAQGFKSGFKECWSRQLGWSDSDFEQPTVLDIWNCRKKEKLIQAGCIKMSDVVEQDIKPKHDDSPGMTSSERQWLQVDKQKCGDNSVYLDDYALRVEMKSWTYPLHFIDFETTAVAIPFNSGRHPYEGVAFQFSHHTVQVDGTIAHAGEYLNANRGEFPNYDFVRALMHELSDDDGTIFMYSKHENSYLNQIYRQLEADVNAPADKDDLIAFIQSIATPGNNYDYHWKTTRPMVDMLELVKKYYYDPYTGGSNSIKFVLPAILNRSEFLQKKYSQPIYGSEHCIVSHNFTDWTWIQYDDDTIIDPYKQLPKLFADVDDKNIELLSDADDQLANGGAALTAYARMQFAEMSDYERTELSQALLKYCELDTLAMVMIYEGWKDMLANV